MGRYSRKDMIAFASYAKSYQSPKKVDEAYKLFLKGERCVGRNSTYHRFRRANVVYVDGYTVKDRYRKEDRPLFDFTKDFSMYVVESWVESFGILKLITKKNERRIRR